MAPHCLAAASASLPAGENYPRIRCGVLPFLSPAGRDGREAPVREILATLLSSP
jgi:hypothetical protein